MTSTRKSPAAVASIEAGSTWRGMGISSCPLRNLSMSSEVQAGVPDLVRQQPPFLRDAAAVAHQITPMPDDAVAGDEDGAVVGADQLAHGARVHAGDGSQVGVGSGLAEGDPPERAEYLQLRRGNLEPPGQVAGKGEQPRPPLEVGVEPLAGPPAGAFHHFYRRG